MVRTKRKDNRLYLIGLDLSKRETGMTVNVVDSGEVIQRETFTISVHKDIFDNQEICHRVAAQINTYVFNPTNTFILIEDYAYGAKGRTFEIAEICGVVKWNLLYVAKIPRENLMLCSGAHLKQFVSGKGNCKKEVIIKEVFKQWGYDTNNNNKADAFALGKVLESLYDIHKCSKQQQVILRKIREYNEDKPGKKSKAEKAKWQIRIS